jgi:hypothetical protein
MDKLRKEAEDYAEFWGMYNNLKTWSEMSPNDVCILDFIAGANSNYVKTKIIQSQIDLLYEFNTTLAISDRIENLKKQLNELL